MIRSLSKIPGEFAIFVSVILFVFDITFFRGAKSIRRSSSSRPIESRHAVIQKLNDAMRHLQNFEEVAAMAGRVL